jgi:hypothetical protein
MTTTTRRKVDYDDNTFSYVDAPSPGAPGGVGNAESHLIVVPSSAVSAVIVPANPTRRGLKMFNTDASFLYLAYGAGVTGVSAAAFNDYVPGGLGEWMMDDPVYTGDIYGIWVTGGSGSAMITEFT